MKGCFTTALWATNTVDRSFGNFKGYLVQRLDFAVGF